MVLVSLSGLHQKFNITTMNLKETMSYPVLLFISVKRFWVGGLNKI